MGITACKFIFLAAVVHNDDDDSAGASRHAFLVERWLVCTPKHLEGRPRHDNHAVKVMIIPAPYFPEVSSAVLHIHGKHYFNLKKFAAPTNKVLFGAGFCCIRIPTREVLVRLAYLMRLYRYFKKGGAILRLRQILL
jgi:hypothetical protein